MATTHLTRSNSFLPLLLALVLSSSGCKPNNDAAAATARITTKLSALRQVGEPVTSLELNAWYAEPPAAENAAPIYAQAFAALTADDPTSPTALERNQKALELLHQAAARPKCRYPVDLTQGAEMLLPHLENFRKCTQLLSQSAASHAARGQPDLAAQSLLDGLSLVRSLEQEPMLISHLVRVAAGNLILNGLENTLTRAALSENSLKQLQTAVSEADSGLWFTRSLTGERCIGLSLFELSPAEQSQLLQGGGFASIDAVFKGVDLAKYRKTSAYIADHGFYLDRTAEILAISKLPFPQSLTEIDKWTTDKNAAKAKGYHFSSVMLPNLDNALERTALSLARLGAAQAALAVERYRRAHENTMPDSLRALVPQFLPALLFDPFDGQPLRYKKSTKAGFVVYSLGPDQTDQGGTPKPTASKSGATYDITIMVGR